MEPETSRYPVNVAFMCLCSTDLKHCHAPISPAQMAFDIIALAYRVSPTATSAIKSWFWIKDRECENLTSKFLKEKAFTVLCNKKLLQQHPEHRVGLFLSW